MAIDPRTLFLVHGLTGLALGAMFFAFGRAHRAMPCLRLWGLGVTLLGTGTLLIALHGAVPDVFSPVLANTLSMAGTLIVWNGIRVFNGRPPRWALLWAGPALLALALFYWTYVDDNLAVRMPLVTGLLAMCSLLCSNELLRRGPRPLPPMAMVAAAPLMLDAIMMAAKSVSTMLHPPSSDMMMAAGSLALVPLIGRMLTSFCLIVLTAERYIQQRSELEAQLFASQKMEALGTLAGGVAHDLNNTLVPMLALAKLTGRRLPEGSRERSNLDTILQASERARDLVSQILTFSRRTMPTLQSVDLAQIVRDALKLLRASVPTTIEIEERIAVVPRLMGDAGKLHQLMTNLVTNAAHAIGDRIGKITVEIASAAGDQAAGEAVRLSVSDTGCGMAPAIVTRIFDPFFTTKPAGVGTGLGLSVAHGIVTQHGGRIAVDSAEGHGTRFDVYLPTRGGDADAALAS
ncbi:MAG TPA: ATP-binding protein [Stellaceae bacterium]